MVSTEMQLDFGLLAPLATEEEGQAPTLSTKGIPVMRRQLSRYQTGLILQWRTCPELRLGPLGADLPVEVFSSLKCLRKPTTWRQRARSRLCSWLKWLLKVWGVAGKQRAVQLFRDKCWAFDSGSMREGKEEGHTERPRDRQPPVLERDGTHPILCLNRV